MLLTLLVSKFLEDFTLPHRFLVIPPGISLAGSLAKFLSISTWLPPGFHPIPHHFTY